MSVSRQTTSRLGAPPELEHRLGEHARVLERLHEGAVADLDVEHDRVGAAGDLLRHDDRGDQRHDVDRRRHVAEAVELLVGGHEVGGLADDREADLAHLLDERVDRELDAEARDRLELVERAARVPEPAPAHLPDRHAAGGDDRADRDRRLVADAAGRVLVDDPPAERGAEVERRAAPDHRVGERVGLGRRSARGSRRPCRTRRAGSRGSRRARSRGSARAISSAESSSPFRFRSISSAGRIIAVATKMTEARAGRERAVEVLGQIARPEPARRRLDVAPAPPRDRGKLIQPPDVAPLDAREVALEQDRRAVLVVEGCEVGSAADELPQLLAGARSRFVTATSRPPGRKTRASSASAAVEVRARGRASTRRRAVERSVARTAAACTSPTRASTPRARASSTIRSRDVERVDLGASSRAIRSASSPGPQPTSSTSARPRLERPPRMRAPAHPGRRRSGRASRRAEQPRLARVLRRDDRRVVRASRRQDRRARDPAAGRLAAEPGVHRRADVGELALVHRARRVPPGRVGEQQRVLARVVGRRRRRVAAVVGREDEQVARPQRLEDVARAGGRSPAGSGGS